MKTYKVGDEIIITKELMHSIEKTEIVEEWFKERIPIGTRGTFFANRINRRMGNLAVSWTLPSGEELQQNTIVLAKSGLQLEQPEFEEIPIMECKDSLLNEWELVYKGMILDGLSETEALEALNRINIGMEKYEIVFYRP